MSKVWIPGSVAAHAGDRVDVLATRRRGAGTQAQIEASADLASYLDAEAHVLIALGTRADHAHLLKVAATRIRKAIA